jgi:hypothetical protein
MEVCPNACGCVVNFWEGKCAHNWRGFYKKNELRWFINVSIFSILN